MTINEINEQFPDFADVTEHVRLHSQPNPIIIGLIGLAGSGKDTVADLIIKSEGRYGRFAFADKLKEFSAYAFDIDIEKFHDQELKLKPVDIYLNEDETLDRFFNGCVNILGIPSDAETLFKLFNSLRGAYSHDIREYRTTTTPREIAQFIGTEVFRVHYNQNIWLDFMPDNADTVVTDVRFPNELERVKSYKNGIIVRVVNELQDNETPMAHVSEQHAQTMEADFTILNNGTDLDMLRVVTMKVMKSIHDNRD